MSNNSTLTEDECFYAGESYVEEKMVFIVGLGSFICLSGLFTNGALVWLFMGKSRYRNTHFVYLGALAVYDICICLSFFMLFSVRVLFDYVNCRWLYLVYHEYVRATFTLTRIVQTASTYLIIAATTERFLAVCSVRGLSTGDWKRHRVFIILGVLLFGLISRLSTFFELRIIVRPNCLETFKYLELAMNDWARREPYSTVYLLYFNNIVHILFPFVLLLLFNLIIMLKLRAALRMRTAMIQMSMGAAVARDRKESLKAATTTLVAIVTTYLACNTLGFALTLLEHIDSDLLFRNYQFYTFASNTVSLLHLTNSAIRLFIYVICNRQIRRSIRRIGKCLRVKSGSNRELISTSNAPPGDVENGESIIKMEAQRPCAAYMPLVRCNGTDTYTAV